MSRHVLKPTFLPFGNQNKVTIASDWTSLSFMTGPEQENALPAYIFGLGISSAR
jgi:hypothetical protein